jgi:hypothetical protein
VAKSQVLQLQMCKPPKRSEQGLETTVTYRIVAKQQRFEASDAGRVGQRLGQLQRLRVTHAAAQPLNANAGDAGALTTLRRRTSFVPHFLKLLKVLQY